MALNLADLDGTNGFRLDGTVTSVAGIGDVNGDGVDDIVLRSQTHDVLAFFMVFGSAAGFPPAIDVATLGAGAGVRIEGEPHPFTWQGSAAPAGDVNGDGLADIVVGDGTGAAYVVFGTRDGFGTSLDLAALDGNDGFRLHDGPGSYTGYSVSTAGDVNGDGIDDVIVGAPGFDGPGASFVLFGSRAGFAHDIDLDALDGHDGFRINGVDGQGYAGAVVAAAGDVNGDGVGDLIIGAPSTNAGTSGSYVLFGSPAGFAADVDLGALDGANGFRLHAGFYDNPGTTVAGAGDVNGDGIDDIIVGGPNSATSAGIFSGVAYVVFGSTGRFTANVDLDALDGTDGFRIEGGSENAQTGFSVAGAGDVNGDGYDDLIIGANQANSNGYDSGESYVIFGSASGFASIVDLADISGAVGFRIVGAAGGDQIGASVAGAGDVNHDGFDDLIIAGGDAWRDGSAAYVVYGSGDLGGADDPPSAAGDKLTVGTADTVDLAADHGGGVDRDPDLDSLTITAIAGTTVSAGDSVTLASGLHVTFVGGTEVRFDAPGLAVAQAISDSFTYQVTDPGGLSDTATVAVDYRQDGIALDRLDGTNGIRLAGAGDSVAGSGDVNGDGIDDVIVADIYSGQSYAVFGSSRRIEPTVDLAGLDGTNGFRLDGASFYVNQVAHAGDVNGDGFDDLLIGTVVPAGYFPAGVVVFGTADGFAPAVDLSRLEGTDGFVLGGAFGSPYGSESSVSAAGDVNGDGFDDLIAGVRETGYSYVLFGKADGFDSYTDLSALAGRDGFVARGELGTGASVAAAGDINGDGVDDLIIDGYVVFGSASRFPSQFELADLNGRNGFVLVAAGYSSAGYPADGAGDINGDGIDDVIVGGNYYDPATGTSTVESYVLFGSREGFARSIDVGDLDGANGFRIEGFNAARSYAISAAGGGDLNGDGIDDLVVADGTQAYVIFGRVGGFGPSFDLASIDGRNGIRLPGSGGPVAGAGDVNHDGFDDVIVGGAGESYVVYGFGTAGAGIASASVAASADDAEQQAGSRQVDLASPSLGLGARAEAVGLRFTGLDVPDGAVITAAYVEFEASASGDHRSKIAIALAESIAGTSFDTGADDIAGRSYLDASVCWRPEAWVEGGSYRTADLSGSLAALLGTDGLDPEDALVFRFTGRGEREAAAFDGAGEPPRLVVEFHPPGDTDAGPPDRADQFDFDVPVHAAASGGSEDLAFT